MSEKKNSPGRCQRAGARTRTSGVRQKWRNHSELPAGGQGRAIYLMRVRSTGSGDDIRKLRWILKTLLRQYDLHCACRQRAYRQRARVKPDDRRVIGVRDA